MPALFHESVPSDYSVFNPDTHPPSSPSLADAVAFSLLKYPGYKFLPSNYDSVDVHAPNTSPSTTHFSCDDFRMYEFKVRRCMRGRSHDWTECPYAHPGEKARRRDPKRIHYSGAPCPDFRKGSCRRGDGCEFAHGVFECWLHPARYRTQVCKDGKNCKRRVCFFAHSPEQLRMLPAAMASAPASMHTLADTSDGSPLSSPRDTPQTKLSSEMPSSHMVFMSGSAGVTMSHATLLGSSTAASSTPNTFMSNFTHQESPISLHLDSLNGSTLRRTMAQNFLACKGYGGGSFNLNLAPAEYSSVYDGGYEGPAGGEVAFCASPHLQSRCSFEGQEGEYPLSLGPLGKSKYEFASHGFGSPTSTLAAHAFSPPALSPPLSPINSPISDRNKGSFTNPLQNCYVDTISSTDINRSSCMYNTSYLDDLTFRLQHLQIPEAFNHPDLFNHVAHSRQSPPELRREILESAPLQSSHSRSPSLRHVSHGLSCAPRQSMWSPLRDSANFRDERVGFLHAKDASANKIYGEESNIDGLIPDVRWVSELVK